MLELTAAPSGSSLSPHYWPYRLDNVLMLMLTLAFLKLSAVFQFFTNKPSF